MNHELELLTGGQRLWYSIMPMRLYAALRARRNLRRYEPELGILPLLVDPERTTVDAGANRGTYTYFLAKLSRHVYAYEPNPAMRWILERCAARNVSVSNVALSDRAGQAEFAVPRGQSTFRNNAGSLEVAQVAQSNPDVVRFQVPTARLDEQGVSNVGFIKIDVEGHEREVLNGARNVIEHDRPVLLIEMMEDLAPGRTAGTLEFVEQLGYQSFLLVGKRLVDYRMASRTTGLAAGWDRRNPHLRSNNVIFLPVDRPQSIAA